LAIKEAPSEDGQVEWSINGDTGKIEVEFKSREEE